MRPIRQLVAALSAGAFAVVACSDPGGKPASVAPAPAAKPAPAASSSTTFGVPPGEGAVAKLSTGSIAPVEVADVIECDVVARHIDRDVETLGLRPQSTTYSAWLWDSAVVAAGAKDAPVGPFSFGEGHPLESRLSGERAAGPILWLRRPAAAAGAPAFGDLYFPFQHPTAPGMHARFHAIVPAGRKSSPADLRSFLLALANRLRPTQAWRRDGTTDAFRSFAASRLLGLAAALPTEQSPKSAPRPAGRAQVARAKAPTTARQADSGDFATLMDTTTGAMSVQEAIQADRPLFLGGGKSDRSIPLASLTPPAMKSHPWAAMLKALARPAPDEPLAKTTPADFYFVRAASLPALFRVMDALDDWGTPARDVVEPGAGESLLAERYLAQLGLARTDIARTLGPSLIRDVGFTGSDPYLREGSDITVIFRCANTMLVNGSLDHVLADLESKHGPLRRTSRMHAGIPIAEAQSPSLSVRQQRAIVGELVIVSNSPHGIDAVLDAGQGGRARLSDELDFQYMLARDSDVPNDVLAFMGDRFVSRVVGPEQKILEARRQLALGELVTPAYASLLYGWLYGRSPANADDLIQHGLLAKTELTHETGEAINWSPGTAPRSSWGAPAALTPLIDLAPPSKVSVAEESGYKRFASAYHSSWQTYVDPALLRVAATSAKGDGTAKLSFDLRQLPVVDNGTYHELFDFVGDAHLVAAPLRSGLRWAVAIGREARIRRELSEGIRGFGGREIKLDWLGDWAEVGLEDRPELAGLMLDSRGAEVPEKPATRDHRRRDEFDTLQQLPAYAEIAIANPIEAALALTALRVMANEASGVKLEWGEFAEYRDVSVVRVRLKPGAMGDSLGERRAPELYYALCRGALIASLQDWVLRRRIDDRLDGLGPDSLDGGTNGASSAAQSLVELGLTRGGGLATSLAWALEWTTRAAGGGRSSYAEDLLRGAPELAADPARARALAEATFGMVPVPGTGGDYSLTRPGLEDGALGTRFAPSWPEIPVAGSPLDRLMAAIGGVRTELSLDWEGAIEGGAPIRSLHGRIEVRMR